MELDFFTEHSFIFLYLNMSIADNSTTQKCDEQIPPKNVMNRVYFTSIYVESWIRFFMDDPDMKTG